MTSPSTVAIIDSRLCLVCAREGVEVPVGDHGYMDVHWQLTRETLEGRWPLPGTRYSESESAGAPRWISRLLEEYHYLSRYENDIINPRDILDADRFRMAVAVGGFLSEQRWQIGKRWRVPFGPWIDENHHNTPEEAVTRAYMELLYDSRKHPWGGPVEVEG